VKKLGVRLGNWLTVEQAHSLWQAPDSQGLKREAGPSTSCVAVGVWAEAARSRWPED
jgi:hypothetical protein